MLTEYGGLLKRVHDGQLKRLIAGKHVSSLVITGKEAHTLSPHRIYAAIPNLGFSLHYPHFDRHPARGVLRGIQ